MKDVLGTVYVIHFEHPLHHARHYVGWTDSFDRRMKDHRSGRGSSLMAAVSKIMDWQVVLTFPGTRNDERAFKNRKNTPEMCPICAREHVYQAGEIRFPHSGIQSVIWAV